MPFVFLKIASLMVLAALITACQWTAPLTDWMGEKIMKSENDQREYRYLELPNRLDVLLVSDPKAEKSAASLDVFVGSGDDPKDYQGLAHFLEHMLFLGTAKYPEAGEYQDFISARSGSHNAYTSFEHTNYFFDIDPQHFDSALDRFSQFFIAPLFSDEYVEREINAVHSEYRSKFKSEQRRSLDVFKTIVNQKHPFAKFSVGNLETLKPDNGQLKQALLDFYRQHYSASIMKLVVVGNQPLDQLEQMVSQRFAAIPNYDVKKATITEPLFEDNALPFELKILPEKEQRILSIAFPVMDTQPHFRVKPLNFIGNILGHEGKGSLLSYLKRKGWVEGLSAGAGFSYQGGTTFNITIKLTRAGEQHTNEIIKTVFQAINRIKEENDQRWLFDEQQLIARQQFRYQEQQRPLSYARMLASNMHYYPSEELLRAPYLMADYDSRLIERYIDELVPENLWVTLNTPAVKTDKKTYFYQTAYSKTAISEDVFNSWSEAGLNAEILLPEKNIFLAEKTDLKTTPAATTEVPAQLAYGAGVRLWHQHDVRFNVPRGAVYINYRSSVASNQIEHQAYLQMFTRLVSDSLNELAYPAYLAGLNYSLHGHMRGFSIKVRGYDDKQDILLEKILLALKSIKIDAQRFENIKGEMIRNLLNVKKKQTYHYTLDKLSELLYRNQWSEDQLIDVYQAMTIADIDAYRERLFAKGSIDLLVYGNFYREEAEGFANKVSRELLSDVTEAEAVEVVKLKQLHSFKANSENTDAAMIYYLQAPAADLVSRSMMGLTAQIVSADFYTQLRTEKQLGYIVTAGAYPIIELGGLVFIVQSPVAGPQQLQQEISQFIQSRELTNSTLTQEKFDQFKQSLILKLQQTPQNLLTQANRYWQDIAQGYTQFDSRQQLIAVINEITLAQWQAFYTEHIVQQQSGIITYTAGEYEGDIHASEIDDVGVFKAEQDYYHFQ